MHFRKALQQLV